MNRILIISGATTSFLCSAAFAQMLADKNLSLVAVEKPAPPQMGDVLKFVDHKPVFKLETFRDYKIKKADYLDLPPVRPYQETPTWRDKKRKRK